MTKKREKDKYVKLVTTLISMMALVWMGAMNASCSSDDNHTGDIGRYSRVCD